MQLPAQPMAAGIRTPMAATATAMAHPARATVTAQLALTRRPAARRRQRSSPRRSAGPAVRACPAVGGGGDGWAGLWRAGDVHAAADELFAAFLPGLDGGQLRQMGAHLREAADSSEHAADARDDYARRGCGSPLARRCRGDQRPAARRGRRGGHRRVRGTRRQDRPGRQANEGRSAGPTPWPASPPPSRPVPAGARCRRSPPAAAAATPARPGRDGGPAAVAVQATSRRRA